MFNNDKRILLIGASGFIGNYLYNKLKKDGYNLCLLLRNKDERYSTENICFGDICDEKIINEIINNYKPDIIYNLAAFKERTINFEKIYEAVNVNIIGLANIINTVIKTNRNIKIITFGTAEEYGNGKTPFQIEQKEHAVSIYSFSKISATKLCEYVSETYKLPIIVIRPSLAYGPAQKEDMFVPSLIKHILENKLFLMSNGEQTRDFIYIDDLIKGIKLATFSDKCNGKIVNIGSGKPIKLKELVNKVQNICNDQGKIIFGGKAYRENEIMDYYLNIEETKKLLNWSPSVNIDEGLYKTIMYYSKKWI